MKYHTISPYLIDKTRLTALSSATPYGSTTIHDEHIIERMNAFIDNLQRPDVYRRYDLLRTHEPHNLTRAKTVVSRNTMSDILLRDTFRQNFALDERYRKGLLRLEDIRRISDPATRFHISCSRGYERHLVNSINSLDGEGINRLSIRPILGDAGLM
jgi:hypothetical protein